MLLILQILLLLSAVHLSSAFNPQIPSYVDGHSYFVTSVVDTPEYFIEYQKKQQVLSVYSNNSFTATNVVSSSGSLSQTGTASSTISIQTETMTGGMTYLYSANDDEAFYVNVTLNSANYPVLIDTGSPYLWLYSENCTDAACKGKYLFDSSKATKLNGTFDLSYDSGVASGSIYEDTIIIAGLETRDFEFGVAEEVPSIFTDYDFSGVLGLPADNASVTGLVNAVSFLKESGDINSSKFTILMGEYNSDSVNSGLLFLGSTKTSLYTGPVYNSPLIVEKSQSHWEFKIDSVYVEDLQISFESTSINGTNSTIERIGLLDSGTSSIVLPLNDANTFHSFFDDAITDGENYAIYCNSSLNFNFEIANKNWTLTPDMYIGDAYPSDGSLEGYCISNVQGLSLNGNEAWILGILFMKDKYVQFDYENQLIALAERNNNIKFVNPPVSNSTSTSQMTTLSVSLTSTLVSSVLSNHENNGWINQPILNGYWNLSLISAFLYAFF